MDPGSPVHAAVLSHDIACPELCRWLTIVYTTIGARVLTLPLIVKQQQNTARMTVRTAGNIPDCCRNQCMQTPVHSSTGFCTLTAWLMHAKMQMARPEMEKLKEWFDQEQMVRLQLACHKFNTAVRTCHRSQNM